MLLWQQSRNSVPRHSLHTSSGSEQVLPDWSGRYFLNLGHPSRFEWLVLVQTQQGSFIFVTVVLSAWVFLLPFLSELFLFLVLFLSARSFISSGGQQYVASSIRLSSKDELF